MTEQESQDLETLKANVLKRQIQFYEYAVYLDRMSTEELTNCGYRNKTNSDAIHSAFKDSQKDIKKLHDSYIRKYPD